MGVGAPGRQDAVAQEYQAYFELPQRSRTGWIDAQNVKLFLSEPLAGAGSLPRPAPANLSIKKDFFRKQFWLIMFQQLINGITIGSLYALIAIGLTMVYGILRILHIAHAAVFVSGAYLGLLAYTYTHNLILTLFVAAAGCCVFGWIIQRFLYTPLLKEERIVPLIASVGLYIFCEDLFRLVGGPYIRAFTVKLWFEKLVFWDTVITAQQLLIIFTTAACLGVVYLIISQTKLGLAWQATAQDMDTAKAMGVNVKQVVNFNFLIASSIAAIAGVLTAINYNSVLPTMGSVPAYKMFAIVVLGGMGSIPGTIAAGLIIGMAETIMSAYFGFIMPRDAIAFSVMILILIFRPEGLFGKK